MKLIGHNSAKNLSKPITIHLFGEIVCRIMAIPITPVDFSGFKSSVN